ncbi:HAMP domain-containing histidine kinase [Solirubrobacter phytolaccae]|uniref:histidine kinase n=1 Tax=Solirubrobacter phytolaccae TaxID=1404360 RepID=A0A9X3NEF2_9ACTN|nr:HAMP domain-containing sensor histidine kinase [Solirubrobacter phytolaccae]MDA0184619.1 HAMP domain-containing histidine kinase [Solirubrobacter phytolaccae]
MTIAVAIAVAVAVALSAFVAYVAVRNELRGEVDRALEEQRLIPPPQTQGGPRFGRGGFGRLPARFGGPTPYIQLIDPGNGVEVRGSEAVAMPVQDRARDVAAGVADRYFDDVTVGGTHVRVLTVPLEGGFAVQFGRSLEPADAVLSRLRLILVLVVLGGVALAVALGRLVSRNVVAPIAEVSDAARHIAQTEDLGRRIKVETQDEIGELAEHFNAMMDTLERSVAAQRQLVADASHELRTPITSLRTNIEVLAESEALPPDERARLLQDVEEQTTELGMLVADLIELARGDEPRRESEDVRLDALVREALTRARRHAPGIVFDAVLEPAVLDGTRERLARAVNNLLDNAAKHSPPGGVVHVTAGPSGVTVRDHGTGVAEEDLPYLFDRFYRGASSRGRPGSGLGLAIVRQVAEQHGGTVRASNTPTGGAEFTLELPASTPTGEPEPTPSSSLWRT